MSTNLTQADLFNLIASVVMVVCFGLFLAIVIFAAIFFEKDPPESDEQLESDVDTAEIDSTYYPDTGEDLYR